MAVLGFTVAAILLFSIIALVIAHVAHQQDVTFRGRAGDEPNRRHRIATRSVSRGDHLHDLRWCAASRTRGSGGRSAGTGRDGDPGLFFSGIIFAFGVEFASRWMPIPKSLPVDKFFSDAAGAYLMAAFGVTLAPLLEELFFRGMLYPLLRRAWGVAVAVVVTGGAFACIHGSATGIGVGTGAEYLSWWGWCLPWCASARIRWQRRSWCTADITPRCLRCCGSAAITFATWKRSPTENGIVEKYGKCTRKGCWACWRRSRFAWEISSFPAAGPATITSIAG